MWIYKTKKITKGKIEGHIESLVDKFYKQWHGKYYNETFSFVVGMEIVRVVFEIIAQNKLKVHHLDLKLSFLIGMLKE